LKNRCRMIPRKSLRSLSCLRIRSCLSRCLNHRSQTRHLSCCLNHRSQTRHLSLSLSQTRRLSLSLSLSLGQILLRRWSCLRFQSRQSKLLGRTWSGSWESLEGSLLYGWWWWS
jgi:hypothetical protein